MQLVSYILYSANKDKFALGLFIDLTDFDSVYHNILLKKLELYDKLKLGQLLLLVFVNNLNCSGKSVIPAMFFNDTNFVLTYENVDLLFDVNKLFLNPRNTKFTLFNKNNRHMIISH